MALFELHLTHHERDSELLAGAHRLSDVLAKWEEWHQDWHEIAPSELSRYVVLNTGTDRIVWTGSVSMLPERTPSPARSGEEAG